MAILTLRPSANSSVGLNKYGASFNYQCVNEAAPDDNTTYVYVSGIANTYVTDIYAFPDHSTESGTINSVTIYYRATHPSYTGQGHARSKLVTHSTTYTGSAVTVGLYYNNYSTAYETNPYTNSAWTWDEIDAMTAGVSMDTTDASAGTNCTQVYIEVDYSSSYTQSLSITGGLSIRLQRYGIWAKPYSLLEGIKGLFQKGRVGLFILKLGIKYIWTFQRQWQKLNKILEGLSLSYVRRSQIFKKYNIKLGQIGKWQRAFTRRYNSVLKLGVKIFQSKGIALFRNWNLQIGFINIIDAQKAIFLKVKMGIKAVGQRSIAMRRRNSVLLGIKILIKRSDYWRKGLSAKNGITIIWKKGNLWRKNINLKVGNIVSWKRLMVWRRNVLLLLGVKSLPKRMLALIRKIQIKAGVKAIEQKASGWLKKSSLLLGERIFNTRMFYAIIKMLLKEGIKGSLRRRIVLKRIIKSADGMWAWCQKAQKIVFRAIYGLNSIVRRIISRKGNHLGRRGLKFIMGFRGNTSIKFITGRQ